MAQPSWLKEAVEYLSVVGPGRGRKVHIYKRSSSTPFVELSTTDFSTTVHVTTDGKKATIERDRRILPKKRTLYQDGVPQWDLTGPNFLHSRYKLTFPDGTAIDIKTPFYSIWTVGTVAGNTVMIGRVEKANHWKFVIDPKLVSPEFVVAMAFLHSQYYYRN